MYQKTIKEIEKELKVNASQGLTEKEAEQRLKQNGRNCLEKDKKKNPFLVFLNQVKDPLIYILMGAFLVSVILKEYTDAAIIIIVVIINAIIGSFEELKAEKALDSLKKLSTPETIVKRDGKIKKINAEEIVVGDVIILQTGSNVCADVRLSKTMNLKIDESSLTGESLPVSKNENIIFKENTPLAEQKNLAFMSTNVSYGHGEGIVIATGMQTQIGKIAKLLKEEKTESTPLQKKLGELGKLLGIITLSICLFLFFIAIIQKRNTIQMLITAISLAVAAIPEGLPAIVTIVLALGVSKMVKAKCIVRKLHSVETLGAVNVVCSDKTGTLTQNKMNVVDIFTFNKNQDRLFQAMYLCNDAILNDNENIGDPTEIALKEYAIKNNYQNLEKEYPRVKELPFESKRKMMSTMHQHQLEKIVFTKGALDCVLNKCKFIFKNNQICKINNNDKIEINNQLNIMTSKALRVLAFAFKYNELIEENLIFIGLVGMIDPPRKEAIEAVKSFNNANIKTIMITGDHQNTALEIAKQLNIANSEKQCITGEKLDKMSNEELNNSISNYRVFARVSPENKVSIVKAFKNQGNIVAMTGDGVNDAPSLKSADIGIAMGINGTDVAKQASDMILMDDNFASIEKAIKEGRGIYTNIKKSLFFLLSSNIGEVMTMFLAILLNLPIPLLAIHILWINLLTDSLPALALGQDDNDEDIMKEKPRNKNESLFAHGGYKIIIGYGMLIGLLSLSSFLLVVISHLMNSNTIINYSNILSCLNSNDEVLYKARTYAFMTLALSQLFHSFGMKNLRKNSLNKNIFKNKLLIISFLLGFLIQIAVTEIDVLCQIFKTTHLQFSDWIIITMFAMIPLVVHELIFLLKKKKS